MVPSGASSAAVQAQEADRVAVLLPLPLAGAYDYAVPDALRVGPGDFVIAPLGSRSVIGVVWDAPLGEAGEDSVPRERLRVVAAGQGEEQKLRSALAQLHEYREVRGPVQARGETTV